MHKLIEELIQINREHSLEFRGPDARLARNQYRAQHPTEIGAFKCMDGRVNLPIMTETPLGIFQPWRNLGGIFDLGWPHFGKDVTEWVNYSVSRGRDCIILVTYHFSAGETHRGCRGFNYDLEAARDFTKKLKLQVERVFGAHHAIVYPIQVGIETDADALILHGENGEMWDLSRAKNASAKDLERDIQRLFPDMKQRMIDDLIPIAQGNIDHIARVKKSKRPLEDAEHKERVLAIGRGFDWLHTPNLALIVGPFSPDLSGPIRTAAGLLLGNIEAGRIPKDGIVLLAGAAYRDPAGGEILMAREKVKFLERFALDIIRHDVPELAAAGVHPMSMVVNLNTREMTMVE